MCWVAGCEEIEVVEEVASIVVAVEDILGMDNPREQSHEAGLHGGGETHVC